jgi:hypothetical protein
LIRIAFIIIAPRPLINMSKLQCGRQSFGRRLLCLFAVTWQQIGFWQQTSINCCIIITRPAMAIGKLLFLFYCTIVDWIYRERRQEVPLRLINILCNKNIKFIELIKAMEKLYSIVLTLRYIFANASPEQWGQWQVSFAERCATRSYQRRLDVKQISHKASKYLTIIKLLYNLRHSFPSQMEQLFIQMHIQSATLLRTI